MVHVGVVNVVATTHLQRELDLELLSIVLRDMGAITYDRRRFPGLIVKLDDGVSYLIFRTGKIVVVGCRSEDHVNEAIRALVKQVAKVVGNLPSTLTVQIQNIVATADLGYEVDLETLSEKLEHSVYVPDEFPGLIYRSGVGKPSALIFSSGRIVVAGATSVDAVMAVVEEIRRLTSVKSAQAGSGGVGDED